MRLNDENTTSNAERFDAKNLIIEFPEVSRREISLARISFMTAPIIRIDDFRDEAPPRGFDELREHWPALSDSVKKAAMTMAKAATGRQAVAPPTGPESETTVASADPVLALLNRIAAAVERPAIKPLFAPIGEVCRILGGISPPCSVGGRSLWRLSDLEKWAGKLTPGK